MRSAAACTPGADVSLRWSRAPRFPTAPRRNRQVPALDEPIIGSIENPRTVAQGKSHMQRDCVEHDLAHRYFIGYVSKIYKFVSFSCDRLHRVFVPYITTGSRPIGEGNSSYISFMNDEFLRRERKMDASDIEQVQNEKKPF